MSEPKDLGGDRGLTEYGRFEHEHGGEKRTVRVQDSSAERLRRQAVLVAHFADRTAPAPPIGGGATDELPDGVVVDASRRVGYPVTVATVQLLIKERDAAIARAEKAERDVEHLTKRLADETAACDEWRTAGHRYEHERDAAVGIVKEDREHHLALKAASARLNVERDEAVAEVARLRAELAEASTVEGTRGNWMALRDARDRAVEKSGQLERNHAFLNKRVDELLERGQTERDEAHAAGFAEGRDAAAWVVTHECYRQADRIRALTPAPPKEGAKP